MSDERLSNMIIAAITTILSAISVFLKLYNIVLYPYKHHLHISLIFEFGFFIFFSVILFYIIYIFRLLFFLLHRNNLNILYDQEKEEKPLYIKNINNKEIEILEFKEKFKFELTPELRKAIKSFFENHDKPENITDKTIKKFASYLDFKKDHDNYEIDLKARQAISYLVPALLAFWILSIVLIFFGLYNHILNYYLQLYFSELNISQILPYYNLFIQNKVHSIINIIFLILIAVLGIFVFARSIGIRDIYSFKKNLDSYYKRNSEELENFKNKTICIIAVFFLIGIGGFVYNYFMINSLNAKNNKSFYLKNINQLNQINKQYKLNLPIYAPKKPMHTLSAENILAVNFYLGNNGFLKNRKKAIYFWKIAASEGCSYSELNLGYIYASDANNKNIIKTKKFLYLSKARLLIEEAFYNEKANRSIRALAQRVWNQYKLWKYPIL